MKVINPGIYVIAIRTNIIRAHIGRASLNTDWTFSLAIPEAINTIIPKGGVTEPIIIFTVSTTPKCISYFTG